MPKRAKLDLEKEAGLFSSEQQPKAENKTERPIGVYLTTEDKARLQAIVESEGVNRHSLLQYAIKHFLHEYEAGKIQLPTRSTKTIQMP
jgi:hypothetical protein